MSERRADEAPQEEGGSDADTSIDAPGADALAVEDAPAAPVPDRVPGIKLTELSRLAGGLDASAIVRMTRQARALDPYPRLLTDVFKTLDLQRNLLRPHFGQKLTAQFLPKAVLGRESARWMTQYAKVSDAVAADLLKGVRVDITPRLARIAIGESAFAGWRSALSTQASVHALLESVTAARLDLAGSTMSQLAAVGRIVDTNAHYAELLSSVRGVRSVYAARPLGAYRSFLEDLPAAPTKTELRLATIAGSGVSGLVAGDLLLQEPDGMDDLAAEVAADVVEPWRSGPEQARAALYAALAELDPELPELMKGAWHEVARPSPGALVKMATCAVETVDRALRLAAPDREVEAWLPGSGRREKDFYVEGRLTRSGRVRFILRDRGERKLVEAQGTALAAGMSELNERLQSAKHASAGDLVIVKTHLLSVEALLSQLLVR